MRVGAILFLSLQTGAKSFNVAIRSELVDDQFIDIEAAAIMRGSKIKKEIFWGWFLQCARIYGQDIKWTEPPPRAKISQNDLEQFRRIIDERGFFAESPKVIVQAPSRPGAYLGDGIVYIHGKAEI